MKLEEQVLERALEVGLCELRGQATPPDQHDVILARLAYQESAAQDASKPPSSRHNRLQAAILILCSTVVLAGIAWLSGDDGTRQAAQDPTSKKKQEKHLLRRMFRDTDVHVALGAIAKEARSNLVVSPRVRGTVTIDLRKQTASQAAKAVAAKVGAIVRVGRKGILHVEPKPKSKVAGAGKDKRKAKDKTDGIHIQFFGETEVPVAEFAVLVANSCGKTVMIDNAFKAPVRLQDEQGRTRSFRAPTWTDVLELGVEPAGLMVTELPNGMLEVIPALDQEPQARMSMSLVRADPQKVAAKISARAGRNIRVDPRLRGELTIELHGVSWRRALRAVASAMQAKIVEPIHTGKDKGKGKGKGKDKEKDERKEDLALVPRR